MTILVSLLRNPYVKESYSCAKFIATYLLSFQLLILYECYSKHSTFISLIIYHVWPLIFIELNILLNLIRMRSFELKHLSIILSPTTFWWWSIFITKFTNFIICLSQSCSILFAFIHTHFIVTFYSFAILKCTPRLISFYLMSPTNGSSLN